MIIGRTAGGVQRWRSMKDFRELKVWQKAHEWTLALYRVTAAFPREEQYGLTSQIRRACSSIAANLAEGCGRNGDAEFARYCSIAMGSASELEYHLLLAKDLNLIKPADYEDLAPRATELKRMLTALMQRLKADS
jgi:four helix bundle protein